MSKIRHRKSILSLSNLLMVASVGCIVIGVVLYSESDQATKLILTGVFLFLAWGIVMRREAAQRVEDEGDEDN